MTGDKIRRIETLKLKQAIETAAKSRLAKNIDDWAEKVLGRLGGLNDLMAAEAFYEKTCYTNFTQGRPEISTEVGIVRYTLGMTNFIHSMGVCVQTSLYRSYMNVPDEYTYEST